MTGAIVLHLLFLLVIRNQHNLVISLAAFQTVHKGFGIHSGKSWLIFLSQFPTLCTVGLLYVISISVKYPICSQCYSLPKITKAGKTFFTSFGSSCHVCKIYFAGYPWHMVGIIWFVFLYTVFFQGKFTMRALWRKKGCEMNQYSVPRERNFNSYWNCWA